MITLGQFQFERFNISDETVVDYAHIRQGELTPFYENRNIQIVIYLTKEECFRFPLNNLYNYINTISPIPVTYTTTPQGGPDLYSTFSLYIQGMSVHDSAANSLIELTIDGFVRPDYIHRPVREPPTLTAPNTIPAIMLTTPPTDGLTPNLIAGSGTWGSNDNPLYNYTQHRIHEQHEQQQQQQQDRHAVIQKYNQDLRRKIELD